MTVESALMREAPNVGHFIDGAFVVSDDRPPIELHEPCTNVVIAHLSDASTAVVDQAVTSARRAFESSSWAGWNLRDRCDLLAELADAIEEDRDHLARLKAADTGLPIRLVSEGHLPRVVENLRYFAAARHHLRDRVVMHVGGFVNRVTDLPIGVAAIVTPWNSPSSITSLSLGACLVAGNTCILKPSEIAPLSVASIVLKLARLGLPPGVVNLVHGGPAVSRALAGHAGVDAISFTGSQASGIEVAELAAKRIARVSLELGGVSKCHRPPRCRPRCDSRGADMVCLRLERRSVRHHVCDLRALEASSRVSLNALGVVSDGSGSGIPSTSRPISVPSRTGKHGLASMTSELRS